MSIQVMTGVELRYIIYDCMKNWPDDDITKKEWQERDHRKCQCSKCKSINNNN